MPKILTRKKESIWFVTVHKSRQQQRTVRLRGGQQRPHCIHWLCQCVTDAEMARWTLGWKAWLEMTSSHWADAIFWSNYCESSQRMWAHGEKFNFEHIKECCRAFWTRTGERRRQRYNRNKPNSQKTCIKNDVSGRRVVSSERNIHFLAHGCASVTRSFITWLCLYRSSCVSLSLASQLIQEVLFFPPFGDRATSISIHILRFELHANECVCVPSCCWTLSGTRDGWHWHCVRLWHD